MKKIPNTKTEFIFPEELAKFCQYTPEFHDSNESICVLELLLHEQNSFKPHWSLTLFKMDRLNLDLCVFRSFSAEDSVWQMTYEVSLIRFHWFSLYSAKLTSPHFVIIELLKFCCFFVWHLYKHILCLFIIIYSVFCVLFDAPWVLS